MSGSCSRDISERFRSGLAALGTAGSWGGVGQGGWHSSGTQAHQVWVKAEQQEVVHIWGWTELACAAVCSADQYWRMANEF